MIEGKKERRAKILNEHDATVCRECGKSFKMLGKHIVVHGISVRDYKEKYCLPMSLGLICQDTFDKMREARRLIHEGDPMLRCRMLVANPPGPEHKCGRHRINPDHVNSVLRDRATSYRKKVSVASGALWEGRRDDITIRWTRCDSLRSIADFYGCAVSSIRNHIKKYGLARRVRGWKWEA